MDIILLLIILIILLDSAVIYGIARTKSTQKNKILYTVLVLLLPIIGVAIYYLIASKKTGFLFVLAILLMVGCTNTKKQATKDNLSNATIWGGCDWVRTDTLKGDSLGTEIFMKILHDNYPLTIQKVTAIVANPTDIPLEFGRDWHLQKWNGYDWLNAETKVDYGWTDDAILPLYGHKCLYFNFPLVKFIDYIQGNIVSLNHLSMIIKRCI